jgi:hypothetical protein
VNSKQDDVKRHATMLLKLAKSTRSPDLAAILVTKAADLKSELDESSLVSPVPLDEPPPPVA